MPIGDPTPPVVYTPHSELLDWSEFVYVWDRLSDFWDLIDNKGLVTAFWEGWQQLTSKMTEYLQRHQYDHILISPFYWGGTEPYPFEIELSSANRVPGTAHSYYINPIVTYDQDGNISKTEFVRSISVIQDFLQVPSLVYTSGTGSGTFAFTTGVHDGDQGILTFHDSDYLDGDRLWSDSKHRMWVMGWRAKSRDDFADRFGPFVGYGDRIPWTCNFNGIEIEHEKEEFGTMMDINGLFYVQEFGPVIPNLEIGLYITNEWPVSPLGGYVREINGTDSITIEFYDGTRYEIENITGLPFQVETDSGWVDLQVGDYVPGMIPLIHGLDIEDIFTDPWYWKNLPIGWAERWHTFTILFNGELVCDGTSSGQFPIDCGASMAFIMRNKPIGDKPYMAVILDEIPRVNCLTTLRPLLGDLIDAIFDASGFWSLGLPSTIDWDATNAFAIPGNPEYLTSVAGQFNWYGLLIGDLEGFIASTNYESSVVEATELPSTGSAWTSYEYSC